MEVIKNLIIRLRHVGVLLLVGIILIIYVGFGTVYWQQGAQQTKLSEQIAKLGIIIAKPLPPDDNLRTEYDKVNKMLVPKTDSEVIEMLVDIAEESGIDINPADSRFLVPAAQYGSARVGSGNYRLMSFKNIHVQGDYGDVMAFISDLDSGKTLSTMNVTAVLKRVTISQTEAVVVGEEGARRAEFRTVATAVSVMMNDNGLSEIPKPMDISGGIATNLMGDDPDTTEVKEGFPDIDTTTAEKGYTGSGLPAPRGGYVLYNHDKTSTDNTSNFQTVSYINLNSIGYFSYSNNYTTHYYYTCEADGTVRQFDGSLVATAKEYLENDPMKIETIATVDVDIYMKP